MIRGRRLVLLRGLRFRPVCLVLRIMGGSGSGDVNVGCISVEVASDMMPVLGKDGGAVVMRGGWECESEDVGPAKVKEVKGYSAVKFRNKEFSMRVVDSKKAVKLK